MTKEEGKPVEAIRCFSTKLLEDAMAWRVSNWYSQYTGRSIGRLMHFLYDIYHMTHADSYKLGDGNVTYGNDVIATYTWLDDTDVPRFTFSDSNSYLNKKQEEVITNLNLLN